ncbi:DUF1643 domain-containing protein [Acidipila sp. EB88]|uniref:DUF1643 domain-containing protein n=1 Tax=Acidipila sp. EB88 TaxID=2305226 RepID=UPI0035190443
MLQLPEHVKGSAVFGGARKEYRYRLERCWDKGLPTVLFAMMNPSTAEPAFDDPSIATCRRYAVAWGFGTLLVGNTFAYRATNQRRPMEVADRVGPDNDRNLLRMARQASLPLLAYGQPHKLLRPRGFEVTRKLSKRCLPHVLAPCRDATSGHPLSLRGDLQPTVWRCDNLEKAPLGTWKGRAKPLPLYARPRVWREGTVMTCRTRILELAQGGRKGCGSGPYCDHRCEYPPNLFRSRVHPGERNRSRLGADSWPALRSFLRVSEKSAAASLNPAWNSNRFTRLR